MVLADPPSLPPQCETEAAALGLEGRPRGSYTDEQASPVHCVHSDGNEGRSGEMARPTTGKTVLLYSHDTINSQLSRLRFNSRSERPRSTFKGTYRDSLSEYRDQHTETPPHMCSLSPPPYASYLHITQLHHSVHSFNLGRINLVIPSFSHWKLHH